jgi:hypothetical protein
MELSFSVADRRCAGQQTEVTGVSFICSFLGGGNVQVAFVTSSPRTASGNEKGCLWLGSGVLLGGRSRRSGKGYPRMWCPTRRNLVIGGPAGRDTLGGGERQVRIHVLVGVDERASNVQRGSETRVSAVSASAVVATRIQAPPGAVSDQTKRTGQSRTLGLVTTAIAWLCSSVAPARAKQSPCHRQSSSTGFDTKIVAPHGYRAFRCKDPGIDALMRKRGLPVPTMPVAKKH